MRKLNKPAAVAAALAVIGAMALTGCDSGSGTDTKTAQNGAAFGTLPEPTGKPMDGGVVNIAEQPGAGPTYIFPVVPGSANSVYVTYQFQWLMFRPLYWHPTGATPKINDELSLAAQPKYSNDNKTVTIDLKQTYKWSDGKSVTAEDLLFDIALIRAAIKENPSNWANYTPGQFPDNVVSAKAASQYSVTLELDQPYNPAWFTNTQLASLTPLPSSAWNKASADGPGLDYSKPENAKAIYDFLAQEASSPTTFDSNPLWQVVDGPFKLKSYNASTHAYSMVPNEAYTGPQKPHISQLNALAFTSGAAEFNQLKTGKLTAGRVDPSNVSQIDSLKRAGYNVYGLPNYGFNFIMLNFKNTTDNADKIIGQLYVRQALQHLIDQPAYIKSKGIYNGAASENYSSVPNVSGSPYTVPGADKSPYPYDPRAAKKLLSDHGWKVVTNGATECVKPGTGDDECGKGIPQGQQIKFNLFYSNTTPVNQVIVNAFASEAKKVGITVTTAPKTFSYMIQHFNLPAAPSEADTWGMEQWGGFSIQPYPTANSIFNTDGSGNVGGYSNPKADELIHQSVYGSDPNAVQAEGEFLSKDLPVLWLPVQDIIWASKKNLSGTTDSFASLTQNVFTPEYWYFTK